MSKREEFASGFGQGWRSASSSNRRFRWVPVMGLLVGGAAAIYVLVRLSGA
jgi:glycerol uptake facilitator-like aquaporin